AGRLQELRVGAAVEHELPAGAGPPPRVRPPGWAPPLPSPGWEGGAEQSGWEHATAVQRGLTRRYPQRC
ncbi:unnamed protein product, partial [Urochloa humidicola]